MNSLYFGAVTTIIVILGSMTSGSIDTFLQWHSILIVFGGSAAILLFSTPNSVLRALYQSLKALVRKDTSFDHYKDDLIEIAKHKKISGKSQNPLIQYASDLWEQGIEPDLFTVLVSQKRSELESDKIDSVQALKNLAKYPPALGMTGTVMGMVALFANLDSNKENIGTNLAMAMTATFFGLILTNTLLGPLADRLHVRHIHEQRLYSNIYKILLLINQSEPISLITDEMEMKVA